MKINFKFRQTGGLEIAPLIKAMRKVTRRKKMPLNVPNINALKSAEKIDVDPTEEGLKIGNRTIRP